MFVFNMQKKIKNIMVWMVSSLHSSYYVRWYSRKLPCCAASSSLIPSSGFLWPHVLFWMTDGTIEITTGLSNGHALPKSFDTNGHCHPHQPDTSELGSNMCGSLHLSGSPSSYTSLRPLWATISSDFSDHLHYGHYHGFGDTAEDIEDTGSRHEHITTVKLEQHYNQEVLNAMQLFHGSWRD